MQYQVSAARMEIDRFIIPTVTIFIGLILCFFMLFPLSAILKMSFFKEGAFAIANFTRHARPNTARHIGHRFGAGLGQREVGLVRAVGVGVTLDADLGARVHGDGFLDLGQQLRQGLVGVVEVHVPEGDDGREGLPLRLLGRRERVLVGHGGVDRRRTVGKGEGLGVRVEHALQQAKAAAAQ